MMQPLWRTVGEFLKKLKTEVLYDPIIPLLGIYLEKTIIQKFTCTPVQHCFRKTPKCPSTEEWTKKMRCIYMMEFC